MAQTTAQRGEIWWCHKWLHTQFEQAIYAPGASAHPKQAWHTCYCIHWVGKPHSSEILQVYLEHMHWHTNDMHYPRSREDALDGHIDRSRGLEDDLRGWADIPSMPNKPETANISRSEGAGIYLGPGDAKHGVRETDGVGSHADTSTWSTDIPSIKTNTLIPTIAPETISMHLIESKPLNPPTMSANGYANETDGSRNPPHMLDMCRSLWSIHTQ